MIIVSEVNWENGVSIGKQYVRSTWDEAYAVGVVLTLPHYFKIDNHIYLKAQVRQALEEDNCYIDEENKWGVFITMPESEE